jgi:adhesin HecA-like repeat protein
MILTRSLAFVFFTLATFSLAHAQLTNDDATIVIESGATLVVEGTITNNGGSFRLESCLSKVREYRMSCSILGMVFNRPPELLTAGQSKLRETLITTPDLLPPMIFYI